MMSSPVIRRVVELSSGFLLPEDPGRKLVKKPHMLLRVSGTFTVKGRNGKVSRMSPKADQKIRPDSTSPDLLEKGNALSCILQKMDQMSGIGNCVGIVCMIV